MEVAGAHFRPRGSLKCALLMTKNEFRTSDLCPPFGRLVYYGWCSSVFFSQQYKSAAAQTTQDTKVKIKRNQ